MAHPNEDLLREGYDAFSRGDMDWMRRHWSDDVVWHTPGQSPVAGDYRGADEIIGSFGKLVELTGGSLRVELHDVLANDTHAVGLHTTGGEREGRTLRSREVLVAHIEDGKFTEFWLHPGDQYEEDRFWGPAPDERIA